MRLKHLGLLVLIGCGDNLSVAPDASGESAPPLRNPVSLPDSELALRAARLLGANVVGAAPACSECHGVTRQQLRHWQALSDAARSTCLGDLAITSAESARAMIDCMRVMPAVATSDFGAARLGIYTTATHLPWFEYAFTRAYGDDGPARLTALQVQAAMPRGDATPFTQDEFDIVAEWFARGLPRLEQTVPEDPPTTCTPAIDPGVATHVTAMASEGWRALNRTNLLAMHGCGSATDPRDCLAATVRAADTAYGASWDVSGYGELRVLREVTYTSQFWTRSSPDGRFVAHGVANVPGSYLIDLQRDVLVPIAADLDPAFFPDNSGFAFLGVNRNVCAMSVLTSNPDSVSMTEPACTRIIALGQYEHLGRILGGGDYLATDSLFVSDNGGAMGPTLQDPTAAFPAAGFVDFVPMIFDGLTFDDKPATRIVLPFEGDAVMSPSGRLLMTRLAGPGDRQLGFVLRQVLATPADVTYDIAAPELARYCTTGGKPAFSFDERWVVFHHYVTDSDADAQALGFTGAADPGFAPYRTEGAANLYLMDLQTGVPVRITHMAPGQYALYPHFRSDGWIYAQVRDRNAEMEYVIASEAALVVE